MKTELLQIIENAVTDNANYDRKGNFTGWVLLLEELQALTADHIGDNILKILITNPVCKAEKEVEESTERLMKTIRSYLLNIYVDEQQICRIQDIVKKYYDANGEISSKLFETLFPIFEEAGGQEIIRNTLKSVELIVEYSQLPRVFYRPVITEELQEYVRTLNVSNGG